MVNELPLPARVDEIDEQIQTLELLQQGLDALTAVRNSLDATVQALDGVKDDLKGETLTFKDLIKLETDKTTGEPTISLETSKIDPLKLDKTQLPANLVEEATRAQKALEELV
jgi:FtsZ-binding cell division protein ZapB